MADLQPNDWENHRVVGRNKQPAHATLLPYAELSAALSGDRDQTPYFRLLNGDWQFHFAPNPAAAPAAFYRPGFDSRHRGVPPGPRTWQVWGMVFRAT